VIKGHAITRLDRKGNHPNSKATLKALQTSNLRFTRVNTGFRHHLIPSVFVARLSQHGESTAPSRIKTIFRFRPGPGCPTKNPH